VTSPGITGSGLREDEMKPGMLKMEAFNIRVAR
jgi:hypothetical protein